MIYNILQAVCIVSIILFFVILISFPIIYGFKECFDMSKNKYVLYMNILILIIQFSTFGMKLLS